MPAPATDRPEVDLPEKDRYTSADYRQLPEGAPYELLRGDLVVTPAPSPSHQRVLRYLFRLFDRFVTEYEAGELFFAPIDVQLSEATVLQPDLVFVDRDRTALIGEQTLEGPPDLVVEVLSPASAHRDLTEKKRLYETHGVREYWIVDPDSQTVEVFENAEDGFVQAARAVEEGTVGSTVLDGLDIDLAAVFSE